MSSSGGEQESKIPKVWLAVHAWYHPASETDSYRRNIARALTTVGLEFGIFRGKAIPHGLFAQAVLPVLLRDVLTYGNSEGIVHDLYGDSIFRDAQVATIQDLYWNGPQGTIGGRIVRRQQLLYQSYPRTVRRAKVVVVTTAYHRGQLLRIAGSEFKEKVEVVPVPCLPDNPGIGSHSRYDVLWVGTALKRKSPMEFIKAVALLPKRLSIAMRLTKTSGIISEDASKIRGLVAEYKREGRRVDLLESRLSWEAMDELYRSSKCLVSTSKVDPGFHMPVAEAYFRGTNVVLPDTGFYRAIYGNEEGIHWYSSKDNFVDTIVSAAEYGPFRIDHSLAERCSFAAVGGQLKSIYERASKR